MSEDVFLRLTVVLKQCSNFNCFRLLLNLYLGVISRFGIHQWLKKSNKEYVHYNFSPVKALKNWALEEVKVKTEDVECCYIQMILIGVVNNLTYFIFLNSNNLEKVNMLVFKQLCKCLKKHIKLIVFSQFSLELLPKGL